MGRRWGLKISYRYLIHPLPQCSPGWLLALVTYLCQGKVGGCHLGPGLLQLPSCSQDTQVQGVHRGVWGYKGVVHRWG